MLLLRRSFVLALACTAVCLVFGIASGCQNETTPVSETTASSSETANRAPAMQTFGEDVHPETAIPVARLRDSAARRDGRLVTVQGPIREVCQKKGCWLALGTGDDRPVRVLVPRTEDGYGFTLPPDASGHAVVHGTLRIAALDRPTRDHYAADSATRPDSVEVHIDARGIALTRSGR